MSSHFDSIDATIASDVFQIATMLSTACCCTTTDYLQKYEETIKLKESTENTTLSALVANLRKYVDDAGVIVMSSEDRVNHASVFDSEAARGLAEGYRRVMDLCGPSVEFMERIERVASCRTSTHGHDFVSCVKQTQSDIDKVNTVFGNLVILQTLMVSDEELKDTASYKDSCNKARAVVSKFKDVEDSLLKTLDAKLSVAVIQPS